MSQEPPLLIVKLTESFESLWPELAEELGVEALFPETVELAVAELGDHGLVILAAGGEEANGLDVLTDFPAASRGAVYLVGATTEHRFGIEAVRRGAADYFALPADADLLRRTIAARVSSIEAMFSARAAKLRSVSATWTSATAS